MLGFLNSKCPIGCPWREDDLPRIYSGYAGEYKAVLHWREWKTRRIVDKILKDIGAK